VKKFKINGQSPRDNFPVQVVITGGSGLTTAIFSEVPPLSDDPGLAADVLQLLVAAGKRFLIGAA
jgi:hypothetical protein